MDKTNFQLVQEFHQTFNIHGVADKTDIEQIAPMWVMRNQLLQEEYRETTQAMVNFTNTKSKEDMVEVVDGLGDMLYVIYGTLELLGVNADLVFAEIHRSNMSKLGEDGKPILNDGKMRPDAPIGKVIKGPNYFKPNLDQFVSL